jgi:exopolyphosphatase/guanosine-5'-triphosphate,3'-diphosphate pyrophosphatase
MTGSVVPGSASCEVATLRLGVLDVGSNTIHLLLVDAHPGANPVAAGSFKQELMLTGLIDDSGAVTRDGVDRLVEVIREAAAAGEEAGVEDLTAFATSALREATNGEDVLAAIRERTEVDLDVLDGPFEASLTFLAARRWFGWSAGRLLLFDIGGGSLELAAGRDEEPAVSLSLPLGAGRLTRTWLPGDPPHPSAVEALTTYVRSELADVAGTVADDGTPDLSVATSKTFRSLARIAGAAGSKDGPYVRRTLRYDDLVEIRWMLASMPLAKRAKLPGVSPARASQLLAGAIVAEAALDALAVDEVVICPWALREGVILRRLDWLLTA